ncbi:putative oligopeptide transporter [Violaceomyces palustris]|uniref:Oligopeptide transporter n=1 Tax=Violaceomyces palustris TaxID=1673888 RepID=A0ACD0P7D4_9BASI|nr:putative oligopeptide transporter [Violaceomyces palustris]
MNPNKPGTRGGTGSGRPMTSSRPMTGTARPGTRAGTSAGRPVTRGVGAPQYEEEYMDEWDEDEYESEDDGDVFAFVPPDIGPAPELAQNPLNPSVDAQQHEQVDPNAGPPTVGTAGEEDTYYYDEATGAVYDSQGRLVDMPPGFDPLALAGQDTPAMGLQEEVLRDETGRQTPMSGSTAYDMNNASRGSSNLDQVRAAIPLEQLAVSNASRTAVEARASYDSVSTTSRDVSGPPLSHARSYGAFPSMEALPEVDSIPPNSRGGTGRSADLNGRRDLGTTASGGISVDRQIPAHAIPLGHGRGGSVSLTDTSGMRQRGNRLSFTQDDEVRRSPDSDAKYQLESGEYLYDGMDPDDKIGMGGYPTHRVSLGDDLGRGDGLAHPTVEGAQVGLKGIRMVELEMEMEEDSPYPEVRASVSNIDDPDMPVLTVRMWFISLLLTILAGAANMFFNFRYPAPSVSPIIVLLVAYPFGKLLAAILPIRTFTAPKWLGGFEWSLNPGVYNIKEHALATIMSNVSISQAYAINVLIVQDSPLFYNDPRDVGFAILFVLTSQIIGFGLAGMCRRFLVWPASMIWPQNLVSATILNTLHAEEEVTDGSMTRFRFFSVVSAAAFFFYFLPGFLFQALSTFNWVCWIWPENIPVNVVFGVAGGLGLSVLTFDWTQITYIGSPLITPWWAECNIFAGFIGIIWIVTPILYFTNTWYTSYLPISSPLSYDRFGNEYDIRRVVTNGRDLDKAAYESYSPLYLSTTYALVYFTGFATLTSVLVHTVLYHGKALVKGVRNVRTEEDDIHAKFMRHYPEVPDWWYASVLLGCFSVAVIVIEVWNTGLPVWGLLISILIPAIYILPTGFVYAMTGQLIGTNLIGEFIAGYAMPGQPLPNMMFKAFALQGLLSGLQFVQDLKLGHYMKIPPRAVFLAQIVGTTVAGIVQIGVKEWMFSNVPDLCSPTQPHRFTCPHINVFYTASLIWGTIGPDRVFGKGSIYSPVYYALILGALIPIPFWLLARRYPKSWVKYISWPIIFSGTSYMPPASGINYSSWFAIGFIFQYLIRRYNFRWWSKYNFVLAAALDSGTIVSTIFVFLTLSLPKDGELTLNWWGNTVFLKTADAIGIPFKVPPEEGFGKLPRY